MTTMSASQNKVDVYSYHPNVFDPTRRTPSLQLPRWRLIARGIVLQCGRIAYHATPKSG